MKLLKSLLAFAVVLGFSVDASAEIYVSAGLGVASNSGSGLREGARGHYKDSTVYSLAVGYDLPFVDLVRVEGEYIHNRVKLSRGAGKTNLDGVFANVYATIPFPLPLVSPYVGAGMGPVRYESDTLMGFQLMAGVDAEIFVIPLIASLEYRYQRLDNKSKTSEGTYKSYMHALMAKVRYEF